MNNDELEALRIRLKTGEFDGTDIMMAWIAIEDLIKLKDWQKKILDAYPYIDSYLDLVQTQKYYNGQYDPK